MKICSPAGGKKTKEMNAGDSFIFDSWRSFSANNKRANFTSLFGPFNFHQMNQSEFSKTSRDSYTQREIQTYWGMRSVTQNRATKNPVTQAGLKRREYETKVM